MSLDRLAQQLGIEESFRDAAGEVRRTSPQTKRALLAAMGIPARTDEDAARVFAELERVEWNRSVPRTVVTLGEAIGLHVVVPGGTNEFAWRLSQEDGAALCGASPCDDSTRIECRDFEGRTRERHSVKLRAAIPVGYHAPRSDVDDASCLLVVSPGRCWLPAALEKNERLWGMAVQLYLLRSSGNWGIGDFTDLKRLVELVREAGGGRSRSKPAACYVFG